MNNFNAHNYVIFKFSKKRSTYSERVCKNALEKCIFIDLFTSVQTEKIPSSSQQCSTNCVRFLAPIMKVKF